jgi:hypothetical protein
LKLPLGGSVKNIISINRAMYAKKGGNLKPQRQSPAACATPDPTMYPNPL